MRSMTSLLTYNVIRSGTLSGVKSLSILFIFREGDNPEVMTFGEINNIFVYI